MSEPVVNITIPVFNRFHLTQKTILSLRRCSQKIPFVITVVDNGSEPELGERLLAFHKDGIIDHLFRLPKNMGISCAANIGWKMVQAPFYMKLDNDILILDPEWLSKLFKLWSHGAPLSTLSPVWKANQELLERDGNIYTPDGILGRCVANGAGAGILIPKEVSDVLGYWNEDYGLYGAEDGDYGLRMACASFPQYFYQADDLTEHMGVGESQDEPWKKHLNKTEEYESLFVDPKGGKGLFKINNYLYNMCIRSWQVPLRYEVVDVDKDHRVHIAEREEYIKVRKALQKIKFLIDRECDTNTGFAPYDPDFVKMLKIITAKHGIGCS